MGTRSEVILFNMFLKGLNSIRNFIAYELINHSCYGSHLKHLVLLSCVQNTPLMQRKMFSKKCVYVLWSPITDKWYIGSTIRGEWCRWQEHLRNLHVVAANAAHELPCYRFLRNNNVCDYIFSPIGYFDDTLSVRQLTRIEELIIHWSGAQFNTPRIQKLLKKNEDKKQVFPGDSVPKKEGSDVKKLPFRRPRSRMTSFSWSSWSMISKKIAEDRCSLIDVVKILGDLRRKGWFVLVAVKWIVKHKPYLISRLIKCIDVHLTRTQKNVAIDRLQYVLPRKISSRTTY